MLGCSSNNAMIYIRGHHKMTMTEAMGNKGWSYDKVTSVFQKG
jgi:choline dehydrogenase-like flavoprotein